MLINVMFTAKLLSFKETKGVLTFLELGNFTIYFLEGHRYVCLPI